MTKTIMKRRALTKWHYTVGAKLTLILGDGMIKPATSGVPRGERPIVWFSTNQDWEPTADKSVMDEHGTLIHLDREKTAEMAGGLARISVAAETAPHDWQAIKELSGMTGWVAQGLYKTGIKKGSRPGDWWGSFDPVPRSKWLAIQVHRDGSWVNFEDT
jgi:hypothetical protein